MPVGFRSVGRRVPTAIGAFVVGVLTLAAPAAAGPINIDTYYEFGFGDVGSVATGCDPADPAGAFCIESSGTPTTLLDAAPWTFTSPGIGSTLTVTDAFASGDRFQIFDFGVSIGLTSASAPAAADCGDDPVPCLADLGMSHGEFALTTGLHSITIEVAEGGFGSGYLRIEDGSPIPEPATLVLLSTGIGALYRRRRRS
jgi:hypothetical protein